MKFIKLKTENGNVVYIRPEDIIAIRARDEEALNTSIITSDGNIYTVPKKHTYVLDAVGGELPETKYVDASLISPPEEPRAH